jgi:hypothetical protein
MSPAAPPTGRQLRYLRSLASRTATTFVPPSTRRDASREIQRLSALSRREPITSAEPERTETFEEPYATAVHPDEVNGFGSTATWRSQPPALRHTPDASASAVHLLTYRAGTSQRVLIAERRGDRVHVTDLPAQGEGERYAVEELESSEGPGPLRALVEDYETRARQLGEIPMAAAALRKTLDGVRNDG